MGTGIPEKVGELVWHNELGGLTFRVAGRGRPRYIKWQADVDLVAEADRLRWA